MSDTPNEHLGLGVIGPNPQAVRDYRLMAAAIGEVEVDWNKGFMATDVPNEDQNGSGSCTDQAFGYDFMGANGIQLSRNDMYSRTGSANSPGAFPTDPYELMVKKGTGVHLRKNAPEPKPQTEAAMKQLVFSDKPRYHDKFVVYWAPPNLAIDTIAQLIQAWDGITGCVNITWEGWANKQYPRAPISTDKQWAGSHMLALRGFKLVNGEKKIVAKSSWKNPLWHYLGEDYFNINSGHAFGVYAAEYKDNMPEISSFAYFVKQANGKISKVEDIDIPENFVYQAKLMGYDVPLHKNPDGSLKRDQNGNIMPIWEQVPFQIKNATIN